MKYRKVSLIFMVLGLVLAACNPSQGNFNVYLVAQDVPHDVVVKGDLENLQLEEQAFLSESDIVWYDPDTHEMALNQAALQRIQELDIPVSGGPAFVVCVGSERIYGGVFWALYSSLSSDGVVIQLPLVTDDRTIRFQLGYPESPELFSGEDLRADPQIIQSLKRAGKLRE